MKKIKKIAIGGSLLLSAILPISQVISCGPKKNIEDPTLLTISMRAEDLGAWKPVFNDFSKKTNVEVKYKITSNQKNDYATWSTTGGLADLSLADQNTIRESLNGNDWFDPIDLAELSKPKYDIVNSSKKAFDFTDNSKFNTSIFESLKDVEGQLYGMPYGYGAQGIYINKKNFDQSKKLYAFIPKKDGTFEKVDTKLNSTIENIKKFLANSGKKYSDDEALGTGILNDKKIQAEFSSKSSNSSENYKWYDYGPLAMYQRMGSIALSASIGTSPKPGWIKDISFPFELIASLGTTGIMKNGVLDDDKLKQMFSKDSFNDNAFHELFQSYFGYFAGKKGQKNGFATNPKALGQPGEADALWTGYGNTMLGYKWQANMIRDNWYDGSDKSNKLKSFAKNIEVLPAPYGSISIDSFGIRSGMSSEKKDVVYKFLRFIFEQDQTKNAQKITLNKTISPVVKAALNQKNSIKDDDKKQKEAYFNSSKGAKYNGVGGVVVASSTKGVYDIYNGIFGGDSGLKGILKENLTKTSESWIKNKFQDVLIKVNDEIEIREA